VRSAEKQQAAGKNELSEAVARYAFKLMAYKDEYEVARLYTNGEFLKRIQDTFDGDYKVHFHLAPPLWSRRDDKGHLIKREMGPWMMRAFKLLAKLKGLRGGTFDIFGKSAERRSERQWIVDYRAAMIELCNGLNHDNHALAVQIASVPENIRGYGHVKEAHELKAKASWNQLLGTWRLPVITAKSAA
jgi:indolepyruvate ferredoxin oxidoreductase